MTAPRPNILCLLGTFLRRRADGLEPAQGAACVIWPIVVGHIATVAWGQARMAKYGPTAHAFDHAIHSKFAA